MSFEVLNSALAGMTAKPTKLVRALEFAAEQADLEDFDVAALLAHLQTCGAGDDTLSALRRRLAQWDNADGDWTDGTARNSALRRARTYSLLALSDDWIALCDARLPFHPLEEATVISLKRADWYTPAVRAARSFYWDGYAKQLKRSGWDDGAILQLDHNTTRIVEKLADPTAEAAYQSKGLVVGYVQSGKTANFTGLIAKAADAGYRLIIVMAGVLDVLRSQTQRRIDKELIGRELLQDEYKSDPDYEDFASHGGRPKDLGAFDIFRLTGPVRDYQSLGYGTEALTFDRQDPTQPFWSPSNVHSARARIAIVKKNPAVLSKLVTDLRAISREQLGAPLDQVPVLIIDDESDQAGVNVAAPSASGELIDRSSTNEAIVGLLNQLPRSQYIGFTATPSANALIDPTANDIFPKDFLISLPRPEGYMGVADFYDLDVADDEVGPNQRDFVRPVKDGDDKPENLLKAIDSFVLAGAIKLYRASVDPDLKFKHHTMLVHLTQLQSDQKAFAKVIQATFAAAGYQGGKGLPRLAKLFTEDFARVHAEREPGLPFPPDFETLLPFVADCLDKIQEPLQAVRIVNTEHRKDTPDFDRERVWKILIGGAKLSRGYTVEGLTVSYYRRRAGAADTLMQMGRWFGFRRGYKDLVRLFIGVDEIDGGPKSKKRINLYEAFGAICRDEEVFRKELKRYAEDPTIIPAVVPPLVPAHMLRPTSGNKMRNAKITFRNYGGELAESTFAPTEADSKKANVDALRLLVAGAKAVKVKAQVERAGEVRSFSGKAFETTPERMKSFLDAYVWYDPNALEQRFGNPLRLQLEYLRGEKGDPAIDRWQVLAPDISNPHGSFTLEGADLDVVFRDRQSPARLTTYNDPWHRAVGREIAGPEQPENTFVDGVDSMKKPRTAVMLLYPITEKKGKEKRKVVSVGFTLLFPTNDIKNVVGYETINKLEPADAIVEAEAGDQN
jgi:hypothetical protein